MTYPLRIRGWTRRTMFPLSAIASLALPVAAVSGQGLPTADPATLGLSGAHLDSIGQILDRYVDEERLAGAVVGVARDGQWAALAVAGVQRLGEERPMSPESIFRVYSMTKAVTAVAALILFEEGRFQLDDPVLRYLPQFSSMVVELDDGTTRPASRAITVRDLLFHTAGFRHRASDEYERAGVRSRAIGLSEFVDNIASMPLRSDPGARFHYSASSTVLGRLIEVWSGMPLDEFMARRIFAPLDMTDTGFSVAAGRMGMLTGVYRTAEDAPLSEYAIEDVPFDERAPALLEGAVGLVSTVPDFTRFALMLAEGGILSGERVLSTASVEFLTTNGIADELLPIYGAGRGWGAASVSVVVDAEAAGSDSLEGEYRWDGSAGTEFWVDPSSGTVLVTAWQSSPANPGRLRQQIRRLVREAIRAG